MSKKFLLTAIVAVSVASALALPSTQAGAAAKKAKPKPKVTKTTKTPAKTSAPDTTAAGAKGSTIKVMTEAPVDSQIAPYPNIPEAARVYAAFINDKGGINGHKLEIVVCDDQADAAKAADCARKAVEQKVVANVGGFTIDMSRSIPILEENKIAWFGACCPIVAQENTSKISFPLGFVAGFPPAAAIKMLEDGCKKMVDVYGDLPVADVFHTAFVNGLKSKGADASKVKTVKIPLAPGDYSPQAAQVGADADCVFANISEINWPPLITAIDGIGGKPRYYGPQGNLDGKVAEQFPKQTEGGIVANVYPNIAAPQWKDYRDSLVKYKAKDLDWNSLAGLGTWTAFTAFTKVVEGMTGEINNKTFLEAASKASKIDTGGMIGVVDLTKEWTGGGGNFPRIFNRTIYFDVIKGGKLSPLDNKAYDMTNAFDGKP